MLSRFLRPALASSALVLASTSAVAADAALPPVPPVAEIPIAPVPAPRKKATPASETKPATTVVTTTTTTTIPALAAVAVEPVAPQHAGTTGPSSTSGATELMPPQSPPPPAAMHVVLVDELPFKATHTRARELPEHAEHEHERGHHGKHKGRHGRPFHPAPGIVVDVLEANGGATAADLQRDARNVGYWPFRHCYEEGLRRNQEMGGKVSIDLGVAPGGAVRSANVTGSTVHDDSVTLCVAREAAHLSLAAGETATSAKMTVNLATGDEPVPVP
ncbi:MAG TPA: AgmX/PglI C-terminal domain-containing protein, partial [Polyangiaceae bacterium]